jgi:hypothetical protein
MRRFVVRKRVAIAVEQLGRPEIVSWDVVDSTSGDVLTNKRTEKMAYESAQQLEKTHAVKLRNARKGTR